MDFLFILQNIWFILIGVLFAGYAILDGFDLGIGILFPFLAKTEEEKAKVLTIVSPFWDGNEVWLLTAGGALFAAFPEAYATVFSGFYLAMMIVIFALMFRAVCFKFWFNDIKRRGLWAWSFILGSFLPALLFGVALGNVIQGIPMGDMINGVKMNSMFEFQGNFFTLLRPYPLSIGLLGLAAILLQGSTFAIMKSAGEIQQRAYKAAKVSIIFFAVTLSTALLATIIFVPELIKGALPWIIFVLIIAALGALYIFIKKKQEGKAFTVSSALFGLLMLLAGVIHYPNMVKGLNGVNSITIINGSSSELTLKVMLIIAVIGMPIVIAYSIFIYRVFRGKV
ncbi:MAG: cytochrome d ubiquinol oxidase subunit II [Bacteroidales bacterium]|jgi:cytochrome d ubiquinol oxidase subunit II|nr:cytochrome d ubiquinol oxidase subunit II [Bacteroidales bacterium]